MRFKSSADRPTPLLKIGEGFYPSLLWPSDFICCGLPTLSPVYPSHIPLSALCLFVCFPLEIKKSNKNQKEIQKKGRNLWPADFIPCLSEPHSPFCTAPLCLFVCLLLGTDISKNEIHWKKSIKN